MKRNLGLMILLIMIVSAAPAHAFLDYLFGGDSNAGAIGNSVTGDFRAWWSGNPVYNFNPWYSQTNNAARNLRPGGSTYGAAGGSYSINQSRPGGYAQGTPPMGQSYYPPQGAQPQYGQPGGGYYPPQGMPQQYQQPSAGYYPPQGMPQQYQQPSAGYYPPQWMQPQTSQPGASYPAPQPQSLSPGYNQGGYPPQGAQQLPPAYGAQSQAYPPGQASVPSYYPGGS
jgi:hypothetical protein